MKLIHCADIHLGSAMESKLPKDKARERKAELTDTFEKAVELAKSTGAKAILICGDLFDTPKITKTLKNRICDIIAKNSDIDIIYISGNHDPEPLYEMLDLNDAPPKNLIVFPKGDWGYKRYGNVIITGTCLCDDGSPPVPQLSDSDINIVMLHGDISKTDPKEDGIDLRMLENKNIDYLALGHIHSYISKPLDERGTLCYSGCIEGRGFDEAGDKGFVLLTIDDGMADSATDGITDSVDSSTTDGITNGINGSATDRTAISTGNSATAVSTNDSATDGSAISIDDTGSTDDSTTGNVACGIADINADSIASGNRMAGGSATNIADNLACGINNIVSGNANGIVANSRCASAPRCAVHHEFIKAARRSIHIIETDITGCSTTADIEAKIDNAISDIAKEDILRIQLCGEYTEELQKDLFRIEKALSDKFYYSEIKDKSRLKIDPNDYKNDISLKGEFIRLVSEKYDAKAGDNISGRSASNGAPNDNTSDNMHSNDMLYSDMLEERDMIISLGLKALRGEELEL